MKGDKTSDTKGRGGGKKNQWGLPTVTLHGSSAAVLTVLNINEPPSLSVRVPLSFLASSSLMKAAARCHYVIISAPTPSFQRVWEGLTEDPAGGKGCLANKALGRPQHWPSAWPTEPPHRWLSLPRHHPKPQSSAKAVGSGHRGSWWQLLLVSIKAFCTLCELVAKTVLVEQK